MSNFEKCFCAFYVFLSVLQVDVKGQIGFPESDEDKSIKNADNRKPMYAPHACAENELYYPGDQKSDWICDCRPAHLYHPGSDKCHPAYKRGPCAEGEYLTLPSGSALPSCARNPCWRDGWVAFGPACYRLDATDACPVVPGAFVRVLGINATTLALECLALSVPSRLGEDEAAPPATALLLCPPGCKRSLNGTCMPNKI